VVRKLDDSEAQLAAGPEPDWALGETYDDARTAVREAMPALVKKRLLGAA